jgi:hypothetical protein
MSSIQVTLTSAEVWIIRNLLASERARLDIKEREIFGEKFNEQQLQIIESNRSLIGSALTKIFKANGDAKDIINALA